jgi:tight adherence protein B
MSILSGVAIVAALLLAWPADPWRRLRRKAPVQPARARLRLVPLMVVGVAVAVAVGWAVDSDRGAVLSLAFGAAVAVGVWTMTHARRARRRDQVRDQVARGCSELAALLRAGHSPGRSLQLVADGVPVFAEPAAHAAVGGDLIDALQRVAEQPGCHGLAGLAGAWRIAQRTGASMTAFLDAVATDLAAERDLRRTVDTELAAPRLTGRLLGLLPLVGLGLGYVVGGDPVGYLIGSPPGLACLGVGVGLAVAGLVWTERLADRAGELR